MRLQQFSVETELNSMRILVSVFLLLNSKFYLSSEGWKELRELGLVLGRIPLSKEHSSSQTFLRALKSKA